MPRRKPVRIDTAIRLLHGLIFDLETEPQASRQLVVWWDSGYRFARPARRDKTWWDIGPGDRLIIRGQWETVTAVRPYRAFPVQDRYPEITCGRDWLAGKCQGDMDHRFSLESVSVVMPRITGVDCAVP